MPFLAPSIKSGLLLAHVGAFKVSVSIMLLNREDTLQLKETYAHSTKGFAAVMMLDITVNTELFYTHIIIERCPRSLARSFARWVFAAMQEGAE